MMFSVFFYICLVEVEADFANETSTSSILLSTINSSATNLDSTTTTTSKYSLNNSNSEFFDHLLNSTQYNKRENPEFNTSKTVVVSIDSSLWLNNSILHSSGQEQHLHQLSWSH